MSYGWVRNGVWKPLESDSVAGGGGGWEKNLVATVVVGGRANVETSESMGSERAALTWGFIHEDFGAWDSKRGAVEVKVAMDAGVRRKFGMATRRSEVVEGKVALWNEPVPFGEGKRRVDSGETSDEVVFPSLDGSFCGVATVAVWWYALEIDVVFFEGGLYICRTLVIHYMKLGSVAVGVEEFVRVEPSVADGAAEAVWDGLCVDVVGVVVIHDEYVAVTSTRGCREASCLVGV